MGTTRTLEIETARLRLRRPTPDDLDGLAQAWGDPDVTRYLPGRRPRTRERTAEVLQELIRHWDQHGFGFWSLLLKDREAWISYCGLQYLPDSTAVELAYGLAKPYWGQGLTTEAARAGVRYGFEQLGLERIVALAVPENAASTRVMRHVGMRYEKDAHVHGLDVVQYAIARDAYRPGDGVYRLRDRAGDRES